MYGAWLMSMEVWRYGQAVEFPAQRDQNMYTRPIRNRSSDPLVKFEKALLFEGLVLLELGGGMPLTGQASEDKAIYVSLPARPSGLEAKTPRTKGIVTRFLCTSSFAIVLIKR